MTRNLPFEIHLQILQHLDPETQSQYCRVCKHWNEPAKRTLYQSVSINIKVRVNDFVRTLAAFPSLRELVKNLHISSFPSYDRTALTLDLSKAQQYSLLIQYTPNLESIFIEQGDTFFCDIIAHALERGYWKRLHRIEDPWCITDESGYLHYSYYAAISSIKDRLSDVTLDVSSLSSISSVPHFLQYPLLITECTRFNRVRHLTCYSQLGTSIQNLDDSLKLCPAVTEVTIKFKYLNTCRYDLADLEPQARVEVLSVEVYKLSDPIMEYIRHKFPNVKQFNLKVKGIDHFLDDPHESSFLLSLQLVNQLVDYVRPLEKYKIKMYPIENDKDLIDAFIKAELQGEVAANFDCTKALKVMLEVDRSKKKHSELTIDPQTHRFNFTEANKAYLNQLSSLVFTNTYCTRYALRSQKFEELLTHCTHIESLRIHSFKLMDFSTPILPVKRLHISYCDLGWNALKQISSIMPSLRVILISEPPVNEIHKDGKPVVTLKINMPHTYMDRLYLRSINLYHCNSLYLRLTQSRKSVHYRLSDKRIDIVTPLVYQTEKLNSSAAKIELTCKKLKQLSISWYHYRTSDSELTLQHEFE